MKKWQISKPKLVDWYLDFSKESYTTVFRQEKQSLAIVYYGYGYEVWRNT